MRAHRHQITIAGHLGEAGRRGVCPSRLAVALAVLAACDRRRRACTNIQSLVVVADPGKGGQRS